MTSEREPGPYWVKWYYEASGWIIAEWDGQVWMVIGSETYSRKAPAIVGPRIPTPDEPGGKDNG